MIPTADQNRVLGFIKGKICPHLAGAVVLEIIAGMIVFVFDKKQSGVLRCDLVFDGAIPFNVIEVIISTYAAIVLIVKVEGVSRIAESSVLGGKFMKHLVRAHIT